MNEVEHDLDMYKKWYLEYQTKYFKTRMHLSIVGLVLIFALTVAISNCGSMWELGRQIGKYENECRVYKEDLKELMDHVKTKP